MIIAIDITGKLNGAIDYDNCSGLTSIIDIALIDDLVDKFHFEISNFVLNLEDNDILKAVIDNLNIKEVTREGFLVVRKATISIGDVKGCDVQLRFQTGSNGKVTLNKTWPYSLIAGDNIYSIGGHLSTFPAAQINLEIVSNGVAAIRFEQDDCEYIKAYGDLITRAKEINNEIPPEASPGLLLDLDFKSKHLETDIDGRTTIKDCSQ